MEKIKTTINPKHWVEQYSDQLFKFVISRVSDSETAKDLVQDTFLSALKSLGNFREEVSEKNWLYSILKNKIIDHYRSKAKQSITELNGLLEETQDFFDEVENWKESARPKQWVVDYSQNVETKEFFEILEKCKKKLSELQNAVFTLRYLDDNNSDKICKELNISSSNYWVLIHRSKLQIHKCLEKNWFVK